MSVNARRLCSAVDEPVPLARPPNRNKQLSSKQLFSQMEKTAGETHSIFVFLVTFKFADFNPINLQSSGIIQKSFVKLDYKSNVMCCPHPVTLRLVVQLASGMGPSLAINKLYISGDDWKYFIPFSHYFTDILVKNISFWCFRGSLRPVLQKKLRV